MGSAPWKFFCKQFTVCLVRVEKISATPPPEGAFFDQLKFRPKLIFGRKSGFSPFCHLYALKSDGFHENIFGPKSSLSALFFTKNFEKCLEQVLAPKWHSWKFGSFWVIFGHFQVFWYVRIFCWPKMRVAGAGRPKFFRPGQKMPKRFCKKFSSPLDSLNRWNTLNLYGCFGPKLPNLTPICQISTTLTWPESHLK